MHITEKGQVTIPLEYREKYGFLPHSEVDFVEENGRIYLKKMTNKRKKHSIINSLRGTGSVKMSTDEILALTRGKK